MDFRGAGAESPGIQDGEKAEAMYDILASPIYFDLPDGLNAVGRRFERKSGKSLLEFLKSKVFL